MEYKRAHFRGSARFVNRDGPLSNSGSDTLTSSRSARSSFCARATGTGNNISPSFYYALALPGSTGAADYTWNIANCNTSLMHWGDLVVAEPGNMVGPTKQGIEDLMALDPAAYWDTATNQVVSSMNPGRFRELSGSSTEPSTAWDVL